LQDLAKYVHVDQSTIWRWENNDRTPMHPWTVEQWKSGLEQAEADVAKERKREKARKHATA
jgi:hypothetical protein